MSLVTLGSSNLRPINRLHGAVSTDRKVWMPTGQWRNPDGFGGVLGVEDGISGVESGLVLCGITDQALLLGEGNERRSNTVTLLVGN
jgi:hypothetical protein